MSEHGPSNIDGDLGGGPRHAPTDRVRPFATLIGIALAITVFVLLVGR